MTRRYTPVALLPALLAGLAAVPLAQQSKGQQAAQEKVEAPETRFDPSHRRPGGDQGVRTPGRLRPADPNVLEQPESLVPPDADAAVAPLDAPPTLPDDGAVAPVFRGTAYEGLAEVERLALAGREPEAAALARELAKSVPDGARHERLLAELRYAGGVAQSLAGERLGAMESFETASAFAGRGSLREDAIYNAAVERMAEAETYFQEIPEIAGLRLMDDPMVKHGAIGTGQDPLPDAREHYRAARETLLQRLRLDWRDADTRANLELVQRRLDEIARIEANRDDPMNEKKSDEGKETERTEEGNQGEDGSEQTEDQREEEGDTGRNPDNQTEHAEDADPTPGEGAQEGDQQPNPEAEAEEDAEQPKLEEQEDGEEDEQLTSESGGAEQDEEMSQEEVRMILDRLNELDENARKLRAALMRTRMIPVERDW